MFKLIKKLVIFTCLAIVIFTLAHFALALDVGVQYGEAIGLGQEDPRIIVAKIIRIFLGFLGIIAVILIVYAGWLYMTAEGEEDKTEKAKKILKGAIIGLIICLASFAIASFILNKLINATGSSNNGNGGGGGGGVPPGGESQISCDANAILAGCQVDNSICGANKYCDSSSCTCKTKILPGPGEACITGQLDSACAAGDCATGFTCDSSDCKCKETNLPVEGQSCDSDTSLAGCQVSDCANNLVCSSANNCTCVKTPLIAWISPLDADKNPNGAPGNFITIGGQYFGATVGKVIFLGNPNDDSDDKEAVAPVSLNPACDKYWEDTQIIVAVPNGAKTGPIKVVDSSNLWDTTDNNRGPDIKDFQINNIERPGLCLVNPDNGSFGDSFVLQGTAFAGTNQKVLFGNEITNISADNINGWASVSVNAKTPNIKDGKNSVFVSIASVVSNSLNFTIKNNIQDNPVIEYLSPTEGPKGQYVTIYGHNFKNFQSGVSIVKFYLPADPTNLINADVDFPKQCQNNYWHDNYIVIKVPVNVVGDYKVIVINKDNKTSNPADFKIIIGSPGPGLCLLDPYNGPVGQSVNAYGEYFGSSQGTNGRAIFYNNTDSSQRSWADQEIKTNVPNGAQTGPFKVVNNNQKISNGLPFKVGVCSANSDCLNSETEECCPSGAYNAGLCKTKGECSLGGPKSCVFSWTFSTEQGTSTPLIPPILTCSGYNTASACLATDMCPNSPGKCQTRTNIAVGDCGNVKCNETVGCNNNCAYDQTLNKCKLTGFVCDEKNTTLVHGYTAECRKVGNKNIWQINTKGASCPIGTYLETNSWCSVGDLGSPTECVSSSCPSGLTCQKGECIISSSGCPNGSTCDNSGKCIKDSSVCECCCRVANSDQDCCAGLTCQAGGCGSGAPDYGLCSGCKTVINGQIDQAISDQSCNCSGKQNRYCDLTDLTNPTGVCKDKRIAGEYCYDKDPNATCVIASSTCANGLFCDRSTCKCENHQPIRGEYCYNNAIPATCDTASSTCTNGLFCDRSTCKCVDSTQPIIESCSGFDLNQCNDSYFCPNSPGKCSSHSGDSPSCDCCCSIEQNDTNGNNPGCCVPLTCGGRCGSSIGTTTPAIFGRCSDCAGVGNTQSAHNAACNCVGAHGRFCLVDSANPNGVCKDCTQIENSEDCSNQGVDTCCVDAQNSNACRGGAGNKDIINNDNPDYAYCSYYPCDTTTNTCDSTAVASSTPPSYKTLAICTNACANTPTPPVPQFGLTCAKQATSTLTCDTGVCQNFSCLNEDGSNANTTDSMLTSSCGTCCCDPLATIDKCKDLDSALVCKSNQTPCSGDKRGLCCGCASDSGCGNDVNVNGCGADTCCRARPKVINPITPIGQLNICRNTVIEASFDQNMNLDSFNNNMFLIGDYILEQCPAGTKFLANSLTKNNNIFVRTIKKVLISLEKILKPIFGQNVFAIFNVQHNYCLITGAINGRNATNNQSVITFAPQKVLDANREYYVVIKGDGSATTDNIKEGVLSNFGVSMIGDDNQTFNAKTFTNSKIWSFTTSRDFCPLANVIIDPPSYLFQTSENNPADDIAASSTYDTIKDSDKVYYAKAIATNGQEILPLATVYSWTWGWTIDDENVAKFKNNTNSSNQTLIAQDKQDAKTVVTAKATITDDTVTGTDSTGQFKVGKADVYVFKCANPWPTVDDTNIWRPWKDKTNNCGGLVGDGCFNNNFEFYYCRDAGNVGTSDDLPAILNNNVNNTVIRGFSSSLKILKEYYFSREEMPSIVTGFSVNVQPEGEKVVALWASVPNVSGYKLYYGKASGKYDNFIDVSTSTLLIISRPVTNLTNGQTYYFAVSAYYKQTGAESGYSDEQSATPTDIIAPAPPTNLIASSTDQKVTLTWTKIADDTAYYQAFYGTALGVYGNSAKVDLANSCSETKCILTFENLVNNTNYYFAIKAIDSYNNISDYSAGASSTPRQRREYWRIKKMRK